MLYSLYEIIICGYCLREKKMKPLHRKKKKEQMMLLVDSGKNIIFLIITLEKF